MSVAKITGDLEESLLASIWGNLHGELKVHVGAPKPQAALRLGGGCYC